MATVRTRCPGHHRHWFSEYGAPGWRRPTCIRCDAPNPNWSPEDQREWDAQRAFDARPNSKAGYPQNEAV